MASFYDYIPGVGSVVEAIKGNYKQAGIDLLPLGPAAQAVAGKYAGAINEQKQGDQTAAAQAQALGTSLNAQDMQGLGAAESFFGPAKQAITAAYGAPGAMTGGPSQYPVAPKAVNSFYGK
jgi:hypothetical protein